MSMATDPQTMIRLMGVVYDRSELSLGTVRSDEWLAAKLNLSKCLEELSKKFGRKAKEELLAAEGRSFRFITFDLSETHEVVMRAVREMQPFDDADRREVEALYEWYLHVEHSLHDPSTGGDVQTEGRALSNASAEARLFVLIQTASVTYRGARNQEVGGVLLAEKFERLRKEFDSVDVENIGSPAGGVDALVRDNAKFLLEDYPEFFALVALVQVRKNPQKARVLFDYLGTGTDGGPLASGILATPSGDAPSFIFDLFVANLPEINLTVRPGYGEQFIEDNFFRIPSGSGQDLRAQTVRSSPKGKKSKVSAVTTNMSSFPESGLSEARIELYMETFLAQTSQPLIAKMASLGLVDPNFSFGYGYELKELLGRVPKKESRKPSPKKAVRQFTFGGKSGDKIDFRKSGTESFVVTKPSPPTGPPKTAVRQFRKKL